MHVFCLTQSGACINNEFSIDRIDPTSIEPIEFFNNYILQRKPVIFTKLLPNWNEECWTNSFIISRIGHLDVQVERRGLDNSFGTSEPRCKIKMQELINSFELDDEEGQYYLNTQNDEDQNYQKNNNLRTVPEFLIPIMDCFELNPELLGNLVLSQINIWFGKSKCGTSSRLHHDYHDNLYLLLRGKKRFTLFSPLDAQNMYLNGRIRQIFPNGLISYLNTPVVRSDGATELEIAEYNYKMQKKRTKSTSSPQSAVDYEEMKLEHCKRWILTVRENEALLDDGLEELENEEFNNFEGSSSGEQQELCKFDCYSEDDQSTEEFFCDNSKSSPNQPNPSDPLHFSTIPTSIIHKSISEVPKQFENFKNARRFTVHVDSGQMLYLPAGWFHEVTSYNDDRNQNAHLAFNYWLYPPSSDSYKKPYIDDYHQHDE